MTCDCDGLIISEYSFKRLCLKVEVEASNSKNNELNSSDMPYFIKTAQAALESFVDRKFT